jgi:hypothetical protein
MEVDCYLCVQVSMMILLFSVSPTNIHHTTCSFSLLLRLLLLLESGILERNMELTSFGEIFWAVEVWTIVVVSSIYFLASFMYFRGFMFRPHAFLVPIIFVLFGAGYTFVSVGMMGTFTPPNFYPAQTRS